MPQPLSRVKPNAKVEIGLHSLTDKPILAGLVCNIIQFSSRVDHSLSLLLASILGADAKPALSMYEALKADNVKLAALTAAATAQLTPEQLRVFNATIKTAQIAQKPRHKIAHWVWVKSPDVPDALLLADPAYLRRREILRSSARARLDALASVLQGETDADLYSVNKEHVFVWDAIDLARAMSDLLHAIHALFIFGYYMRPVKSNLISKTVFGDDPFWKEMETSEGALRELLKIEPFQEVFHRSGDSKDQNSIPNSPS